MKPTYPTEGTQPRKILDELLAADGGWISGQRFLRGLYLSQYHARIKELEDHFGWTIEHSDFRDEHGFVSYRIVKEPETAPLL